MSFFAAMTTGWFVAGTDTGVGKTFVSVALLKALRLFGKNAVGMKSVAAGVDGQGCNEDVEALRLVSYGMPVAQTICPYIFQQPIAPHIAAELEGRRIELSVIQSAFNDVLHQPGIDIVLMEGVGGFLVPLNEQDSADAIPMLLGLDVILVIGLKLGCLSHALLSVEAILARKLRLAGFVVNQIDPTMQMSAQNIATLQRLIVAPCLGVISYGSSNDGLVIHPFDWALLRSTFID